MFFVAGLHFFMWVKMWVNRLPHTVTHTRNKLYPIKWTRENDPWPRLVDTHLTHRVKWLPLWYDEIIGWRYSMGTRKKLPPEELKHLRANPYTLRATADTISCALAFKEASGLSASRATPARLPSASWATTQKSWALNGSTTPPSGSGGQPSHRRDLVRVPGVVFISRAAQDWRHRRTRPPGA